MQFRIPQTLDGFETAAREGSLVSQEAFAAAKSRPPASLKKLIKAGQGDSIWNEGSCVQLYGFLYHVDSHGLKASQLQLVAQAVSSAGLSAADPNQASSCSRNGTDLSLSIFFTCQMLQHVEVSACPCAAAGLQLP